MSRTRCVVSSGNSLRNGPVQANIVADSEFGLNHAVEFYQHLQP